MGRETALVAMMKNGPRKTQTKMIRFKCSRKLMITITKKARMKKAKAKAKTIVALMKVRVPKTLLFNKNKE